MEERGSEKGASPPQPEGDGLLEGGKLSKNRSTTLQEPTGEEEELLEEEGLDLEIETEKRRISEEEYQRRIRDSCESCGGLEEEQEMVKLGLDVEALFPSMTAARTAEIVRKRIMGSKIKLDGFDWRVGLVYIQMNRKLTPNIGRFWRILPQRRKVVGVTPGMSSRGMSVKDCSIEDQWVFKTKEDQLQEVVGRCVEIAIKIVFENFMYSFGGKTRLQSKGGPIGARLTMACSRIAKQEWGEGYIRILKEA